jgi:hypothetical protein
MFLQLLLDTVGNGFLLDAVLAVLPSPAASCFFLSATSAACKA